MTITGFILSGSFILIGMYALRTGAKGKTKGEGTDDVGPGYMSECGHNDSVSHCGHDGHADMGGCDSGDGGGH